MDYDKVHDIMKIKERNFLLFRQKKMSTEQEMQGERRVRAQIEQLAQQTEELQKTLKDMGKKRMERRRDAQRAGLDGSSDESDAEHRAAASRGVHETPSRSQTYSPGRKGRTVLYQSQGERGTSKEGTDREMQGWKARGGHLRVPPSTIKHV